MAPRSDFGKMVQSGNAWKQISMYLEEKWLVASSITKNGGVEEMDSFGLLQVWLSGQLLSFCSWWLTPGTETRLRIAQSSRAGKRQASAAAQPMG